MTPAELRQKIEASICAECGMLLKDPDEYHPYVFCALKKAGHPPWETLATIARDLGLGPVQRRRASDLPLTRKPLARLEAAE